MFTYRTLGFVAVVASLVLSVAPASAQTGSIVSLVCDRGDRYELTYGCEDWLRERGLDAAPFLPVIESAWDKGVWLG